MATTAQTRRDLHIRSINEHGRMHWQKTSGYNRRSKLEAAIRAPDCQMESKAYTTSGRIAPKPSGGRRHAKLDPHRVFLLARCQAPFCSENSVPAKTVI
jgi:hypothetical protein